MELKTVREIFGAAVKSARDSEKLSQVQMCSKLNRYLPPDYAHHFYPKKLSRLEQGDRTLALTETDILTVQQVFQLPENIVAPMLAEIQNAPDQSPPQSGAVRITIHEAGQLITSGTSTELESYLGTYYCLFPSTDSSSNTPIRGVLEIVTDKRKPSQCIAHMTIQDKQGESYQVVFRPLLHKSPLPDLALYFGGFQKAGSLHADRKPF